MADGSLHQVCRDARIRLESDSADRWDVVLDGAANRNAQTPATWRALAAVGQAVRSHRPRVVVLRAEGPSFSAGLDRAMFSEGLADEPSLAALAAGDDEEIDVTIAGFQAAFTWWREVDAITLAVVQGHAVGAGFQLALACDLRVVSRDAIFRMAETSLGLVPDLAGTGPLVDLVGYSRALEICVTGRQVGAEEAVRLGLAEAAVDDGALPGAVDTLVTALTAAPPGAAVATKHLLAGAVGATADVRLARERAAQTGRLRALAEESRGAVR